MQKNTKTQLVSKVLLEENLFFEDGSMDLQVKVGNLFQTASVKDLESDLTVMTLTGESRVHVWLKINILCNANIITSVRKGIHSKQVGCILITQIFHYLVDL